MDHDGLGRSVHVNDVARCPAVTNPITASAFASQLFQSGSSLTVGMTPVILTIGVFLVCMAQTTLVACLFASWQSQQCVMAHAAAVRTLLAAAFAGLAAWTLSPLLDIASAHLVVHRADPGPVLGLQMRALIALNVVAATAIYIRRRARTGQPQSSIVTFGPPTKITKRARQRERGRTGSAGQGAGAR